MKCIQVARFGGPEVLELVEVTHPPLGRSEILVRIHAAGVNPVDTYIRSGLSGPRPFPYTPGSDAAGVIEALGSEVKGWKLGERVYVAGPASGTYAEQVVCLPEQVHPLPDSVSFEQGAGVYVPYSTAYRALFQRGEGVPGEWVLVHGASGSVGIAAVQWGRAHGLRVVGSAGTAEGLQAVLDAGAEAAFHHDEVAEGVAKLTEGKGPSLILEMLANVNLQKDLDMVAKYGRIVVIGNRGNLDFNPRGTMVKEADVRGMSLFNTPPAQLQGIQRAIVDGLKAGFLRPLLGQHFPLAEAAAAHRAILEPGAKGKIVLLPLGA